MTIGMSYVIWSESLRIKKQMWLMFCSMFCLSDTCHNSIEGGPRHICIIKLTLRDKHETRSTEINIMEITRSKQPTEFTLVPL